MLETLKLLHPNENQLILGHLITVATNTVLALTNRKVLIPEMETLVIQLTSFLLSGSKTQGLTSRSEGAISESYSDTSTIPNHLHTAILSYRVIRSVKHDS